MRNEHNFEKGESCNGSVPLSVHIVKWMSGMQFLLMNEMHGLFRDGCVVGSAEKNEKKTGPNVIHVCENDIKRK